MEKVASQPLGLGLVPVVKGSPEEGHTLHVKHVKILGIQNISRHVPVHCILYKAHKI